MMETLIRGGRVVDPANGIDGRMDIRIRDGMIAAVGEDLPAGSAAVIDAEGLAVLPGLVDMHVHFRDPGQTHKETILTGARAAAAGGVTSVLAMPNTTPPMDDVSFVRYVYEKAAAADTHYYQVGAITKGMLGKELCDLPAMAEAGIRSISEDGKSVMDAYLLRQAMEEAKELDLPVLSHCEDLTLVHGGVMNDDENAVRLGLPGIPNTAEDVIASRDMILARDARCRLHLCHVSTALSVSLLRFAKAQGLAVTAETCPHYFTLTSDDIPSDDAKFKMNPPLRTKADREAVRAAVLDGTIDVIVTDHAPHTAEEKAKGFRHSPFGIVGLETSFGISYTELVKPGLLSLGGLVRRMSVMPAKILGLPAGTLSVGAPADIAVFDLENEYTVDPEKFRSMGRNTPFAGRRLFGRCVRTILSGRTVWEDTNL